jgi:ribonuclease HII
VVDIKELVASLNLGVATPSESSTALFWVSRDLLYPAASSNIELDFELSENELKRDDQAAQVLAASVLAKVLKATGKWN